MPGAAPSADENGLFPLTPTLSRAGERGVKVIFYVMFMPGVAPSADENYVRL